MSELRDLRRLTLLEGTSYLLLVCVAMPLKYTFGMPVAVSVAGGVHGLLFIGFVLSLYQAGVEHRWSRRQVLEVLLVSLIPGSLFWLDERMRSWEK